MSYTTTISNELNGPLIDFTNDIYSKVLINRELFIYDKNSATNPYSIGLYDSVANTDINIKSLNNNLYYNGYIIINENNLVNEVNSAYTDGVSGPLTVSNISVLGYGANSGYINMSSTQGSAGIGVRLNHSNNNLEVKDGTTIPDWISLPDLVNSTNYLVDLQDVNITSPDNGQILVYYQPSNIWVNTTFQLPASINMNGYSSIIKDNSNVNVFDMVSSNVGDNSAFIRISNGNVATTGAIISSNSLTGADVPITIKSKGVGDIILDATNNSGGDIYLNGNTVYTSSNLDVNSTLLAQSLSIKSNSYNIVINGSGSLASDYTLTLPLTAGTSNGQVLTTDGSGALRWDTVAASGAAGSNGQIQFNSNTSFGGTSALTIPDATNVSLTLGSNLQLGSSNNYITGSNSGVVIQTSNGGDMTLNTKFIVSPQTTFTITDVTLPVTISIDRSVLLFVISDLIHTEMTVTYTVPVISYTDGLHLHVFFENSGFTNNNKLELFFGLYNMISGSGTASSLIFSTTGQAASLIYLNNKWRIINTGAIVV
jgi:hypothetical protein